MHEDASAVKRDTVGAHFLRSGEEQAFLYYKDLSAEAFELAVALLLADL